MINMCESIVILTCHTLVKLATQWHACKQPVCTKHLLSLYV